MPTFVFVRQSKELERIRGADVGAIEKTLTKYYKETSAFSGQGHSMLDPSPAASAATTATATTTSMASDRDRLEQLAKERFGTAADGQTLTTLRLRLPDVATPVNLRLSTDRTLNDVRRLLCDTIPMFETMPFEFMVPPATKIKPDEENQTLSEAKLTNAALTVKKIPI